MITMEMKPKTVASLMPHIKAAIKCSNIDEAVACENFLKSIGKTWRDGSDYCDRGAFYWDEVTFPLHYNYNKGMYLDSDDPALVKKLAPFKYTIDWSSFESNAD